MSWISTQLAVQRADAPPVARSRINICFWLRPRCPPRSARGSAAVGHIAALSAHPGRGTVVAEGGRKTALCCGNALVCQCVKSQSCSALLNRQWHKPAASGGGLSTARLLALINEPATFCLTFCLRLHGQAAINHLVFFLDSNLWCLCTGYLSVQTTRGLCF